MKRIAIALLAIALGWATAARGQTVVEDLLFVPLPTAPKPHANLLEFAHAYGLGYTEVAAANPAVDPWSHVNLDELMVPDSQILPAAPRQGIVINLADQRLYYFAQDESLVFTAPIGIGGMDGETPTGMTRVVDKRANPTWIPTPAIRQRRPELPSTVPPGPDNPLGELALYLQWPAYLIHGTNRPLSIGRRLTSGCIRLYPEHIRILFAMVAPGTPVTVVDQPVKVGWLEGELYLQVHPTQRQAEEIEQTGRFTPEPPMDMAWLIAVKAGKALGRVDWRKVERTAGERSGIAVRITR